MWVVSELDSSELEPGARRQACKCSGAGSQPWQQLHLQQLAVSPQQREEKVEGGTAVFRQPVACGCLPGWLSLVRYCCMSCSVTVLEASKRA